MGQRGGETRPEGVGEREEGGGEREEGGETRPEGEGKGRRVGKMGGPQRGW